MITLAVNGALGRMGRRILDLAHEAGDFKISGVFEHAGHASLGKDLGNLLGWERGPKLNVSELSAKTLQGVEALIDFSSPDGVALSLKEGVTAKTSLVIGTTGLGAELEKTIRKASEKIAIVYSPNMSVGANFLFELSKLAASKLGPEYDVEIVEVHHRLKKDAPSGTAKKIAQLVAETKGWDLEKVLKPGRSGKVGERPKNEIGIHALRAGEIVGEHTVIFSGPGETIELVHRAQSRDAFARGALLAARFAAKKSQGLYQMADVLKITTP